MEGTYRLKIKIGDHEFEAEGPAEIVREQFESFKQLVASAPADPKPLAQNPPQKLESIDNFPTMAQDVAFDDSALGKIMRKEGRIVSLRIRPRNVEEALTLLLLGQRYLRGMEIVTGAEIMGGISATGGVSVSRIDRLLEKMGRDGDLIIMGARRGKRYRFTNVGLSKAQKIATDLLATVA